MYGIQDDLRVLACCALPYDSNSPTGRTKLLHRETIPLPIAAQLVYPELPVSFGDAEEPTPFVGMPKTPVHQNDDPMLVDDKIWTAWQTRRVQAESDASSEQTPAQNKLWLRILATNSAHHR